MNKKMNKILRVLVLFSLLTSVLNMGASCNHENTTSTTFAEIGGVTDVIDNVTTHPTSDLNLSQGINYFSAADYTKSIISFEKVLVTNPNNDELAMAYAGIGWSRVKKSGSILDGLEDFKSAYAARSTNHDARVGLASAFMLLDSAHLKESVSLLESMGMTVGTDSVPVYNPSFEYNSEIGTGITAARVHALLAACYYYDNQTAKSQEQLAVARRLDPASDRVRSIESAIQTLGF
jgi:tetratricopeptide (TPR) repeat protein